MVHFRPPLKWGLSSQSYECCECRKRVWKIFREFGDAEGIVLNFLNGLLGPKPTLLSIPSSVGQSEATLLSFSNSSWVPGRILGNLQIELALSDTALLNFTNK